MIGKKNSGNLRDTTFSIEKVLKAESVAYDKKWVSIPALDSFIDGDSLELWRKKGTSCCICGITGTFFAKERTPGQGSMFNRWHLNLYALDEKGIEVQMTKDHILAKAQGGAEYGVDNLQPMCYPHNQKKAHHHMDDFMDKVKKNEGLEGEVWDEAQGKPVVKKTEARIKAEQEWSESAKRTLDEIEKIYKISTTIPELIGEIKSKIIKTISNV